MSGGVKRYKTGLCIGKFYPPHEGHHHLIDVAVAQCGKVFVMFCWKPEHTIPAEVREAALRERHPDAEIVAVPDTLGDDDTAGWAEHTVRMLGHAPEAVFTSEDYGEPYAKLMGSAHVMVDRSRTAFPCSGTMVRENPYACWRWLGPVMRAYFARRVCLVGAESTGKTTLAAALAERYGTEWVPEYGREYCERKWEHGYVETWTTEEFVHIAAEQCLREDEAARHANKVLICDTDAFATSIWHRRYMDGRRAAEIDRIAAARRCDLYLLTGDEIPFTQDGLRDGEHIRHWMHQEFERELAARNRPWRLLTGSLEARLAQACELVDSLIQSTGMPLNARSKGCIK